MADRKANQPVPKSNEPVCSTCGLTTYDDAGQPRTEADGGFCYACEQVAAGFPREEDGEIVPRTTKVGERP